MKKTGMIILLTAIIILGFNQISYSENQDGKRQVTKSGSDKTTKVTVGADLLSVEEGDSSINLRIGNRGLSILESLEGPKINFKNYKKEEGWEEQEEEEWTKDEDRNRREDRYQDDNDGNRVRRRTRFKGHWTGLELGFNNYLTSDKSLVLPTDIDYMTLHSSKSINFNLNFSQLSLGITRRIGLVTGLGLNFNNYRFDGNNNIQKGTNGIIEMIDPGDLLEKSKLATIYLDVPVLLEIQIPCNNNQLNLAAGPIGAVKIGSHTKMVFQDGPKVKANGDFSLNMLRYGATGRVGYGNFELYATYYKTPLFQKGKGPGGYDLYPFEIGFACTFND